LPTLLFLYEPESKIAYWVEVTRSAAKVTDNAFTILVPRDNELCEASASALDEVVRRANERMRGLVGTAWNVPGGEPRFDPADQRRAALLVPRLVAPHPNAILAGDLTALSTCSSCWRPAR